MARKDHVALEQEDFYGLYARGVSDSVPDKFFRDCLNIKYAESDVLTRDGLVLNTTKSNIVRFHSYKRVGENPRTILLDNLGNLFDSLAPGVPIWSDVDIVDFSIVNYNNRAYLTVHNRKNGLPGKFIIVYEGTGMARLAAGSPPSGYTLTVTNSASSGNIEEGIHIVAVCYLTSSGFVTRPGETSTFGVYTATGGFKCRLNNVPIGGSTIVARVIVATKSIPVSQYTGNLLGYEFFFVPDGVIQDNTTTIKEVSFYDTDLQDSADYLLDNLDTIPAGCSIFTYNSRLGICAASGEIYTIRLSLPGDPETFSSVSGFLTVDPSTSSSGVRNAFPFRNNLIILMKNRIYSTADNSGDPNTWAINEVDKSAGSECFGVATVLDARGTNSDRAFIADISGLVSYEGFVRRPELSFNIEDIWKRINKAVFDLVQVVDDPTKHRLFITVPLDAATSISHILYADYSKAYTVYGTLDPHLIKWAIWTFLTAPTSIVGDTDSVTFDSVLRISLAGGNQYDMKDGLTDDFGNAIDSYFISSLKAAMSGWVNHFGGIKLRAKGNGNLQITLYGEDASNPQSVQAIALAANPGLEIDRLINYINERMSVKFRTNLFGEYFVISRLTIYAKELWLRRMT